jgi:Flp pilus assembly protein TadD
MGVTLHEMGEYEEAEKEKRKAIELEPENAIYHNSLRSTLNAMS